MADRIPEAVIYTLLFGQSSLGKREEKRKVRSVSFKKIFLVSFSCFS